MPTKKRIDFLYQQYLNNEITKDEFETFLAALDTAEGEMDLANLMDGTWEEMFETNKALVVPINRRRWFRAAAAVTAFFLLAGGSYFVFNKPKEFQNPIAHLENPIFIENDLMPGGNKAILTLSDGSKVVLDSISNGAIAKQGEVTLIKSEGGQLSYEFLAGKRSNQSDKSIVSYNTISTPKGGQYQLVLADGSKVWLNAASSLTYPTTFSGTERKVTLTGEGYFEVANSSTKPFLVIANNLTIKVMGTQFNVNAYEDESSIKTTLLEGKVEVNAVGQSVVLTPGEQARFQASNQKLQTLKSVDINSVVAWKEGFFSFNESSLKEVMRQLSRWYDVMISYEGEIPDRKFGGKIDRNSNASQVLKILEESGVNFRIEGKKIIIKP